MSLGSGVLTWCWWWDCFPSHCSLALFSLSSIFFKRSSILIVCTFTSAILYSELSWFGFSHCFDFVLLSSTIYLIAKNKCFFSDLILLEISAAFLIVPGLFLKIIYLFIYLFIYFWLCWVFVSVRGLSLVAASGGHSSLQCVGLWLSRPLLLQSTGSRRAGSVVVAHGPSCSAACGIFPNQGWNPCPLHWQADSQPLRHQGSPVPGFLCLFKWEIL